MTTPKLIVGIVGTPNQALTSATNAVLVKALEDLGWTVKVINYAYQAVQSSVDMLVVWSDEKLAALIAENQTVIPPFVYLQQISYHAEPQVERLHLCHAGVTDFNSLIHSVTAFAQKLLS